MQNKLNLRFKLEGYSPKGSLALGQEHKGIMILEPHTDLEGLDIGFELMAVARGKMETAEQVIMKDILALNANLEAGQSYSYPFTYRNPDIETYIGQNANILVRLQPMLNQPDKKGINFLKSIFGSGMRKLSVSIPFEFTHPQYQIQESRQHLTVTAPNGWRRIVSLLVFIIFVVVFFLKLFWVEIAIGLGVIAILVGLYVLLKDRIVGKIEASFKSLPKNNFELSLQNEQNWTGIQEVKVWYEIIEKVVDNRGTSSSTYNKVIFTGPENSFTSPNGTLKSAFSLADKLQGSREVGDASIVWELKVIVNTSIGIPFLFRSEMKVKKIEEITNKIDT